MSQACGQRLFWLPEGILLVTPETEGSRLDPVSSRDWDDLLADWVTGVVRNDWAGDDCCHAGREIYTIRPPSQDCGRNPVLQDDVGGRVDPVRSKSGGTVLPSGGTLHVSWLKDALLYPREGDSGAFKSLGGCWCSAWLERPAFGWAGVLGWAIMEFAARGRCFPWRTKNIAGAPEAHDLI